MQIFPPISTVSRLTGSPLAPAKGNDKVPAVEDPQEKRLREMQEGLKRLQAMPRPEKLAKQQKMNQVGYLQRRLDALKMMLLHASPEQAKALAKELKEIAGELASVAKQAGGGSASSAGKTSSTGTESKASSAEEQAAEAIATSSETSADVATAGTAEPVVIGGDKVDQAEKPFGQTTSGESNRIGADDDEIDSAVLRGLLMDAKKLLKEVIDRLKPKLVEAGKEAKDDLRAAEEKLAEMDKAMQQTEMPTSMANFYGAGGEVSLGNVGMALTVSIDAGQNISVSV